MSYEIEKGIAVPTVRYGKNNPHPLNLLCVGDSFAIEDKQKFWGTLSYASSLGKKQGKKFSGKWGGFEGRIWRIT